MSSVVFSVFSMLGLDHIFASDLVTDVFMNSLSGIILPCHAILYNKSVLHKDIITFARFHVNKFRIIDL